MLSGEGNENGEKTTIGLISKKTTTLHLQHTFFVHFFAVETSGSFLVTRHGRNVVPVVVHFFSLAYFHFGGR